jgi:hypothetical protein
MSKSMIGATLLTEVKVLAQLQKFFMLYGMHFPATHFNGVVRVFDVRMRIVNTVDCIHLAI